MSILSQFHPYTKGCRRFILLGVLCSGAEAIFELLIPLTMGDIVDVGIAQGDQGYILQKGLLMLLLAALALLLGLGSAIFSSRAGLGFGAKLRQSAFDHIQSFSFRNIEKFSTASLVTRLTTDVNIVQMTLMQSMRLLVRAPVMLLSALFLSLRLSRDLSRVFLVALPLLAVVAGLLLSRVGPMFRTLQEKTDALNLVVQENLKGIRVVKSFVREAGETEKFREKNRDLKAVSLRSFGAVVMNMPLMMLIVYGTIIAVLWFGGRMVYFGSLPVGKLTTFFTYIMQICMSLMMVSMIFMMLTRSAACARRVLEVLEETPAIADEGDPALEVESGEIEFRQVSFRYHESDSEEVLQDLSIHIPSGATVGILGATGSGKSSFASLIPRLYEAQKGEVLVGGRPVRDYSLHKLREAVSMVLQQNTLFSGSIRENLLWGKPEGSQEELESACRAACCEEFLAQLPQGLDTDLSQGGVNVSGGQKQRLCLARAILKQPKILILDDSTSAVDTATDAKIRAALRTSLPGCTKLIIAQRVSSIWDADLILVLDQGRLLAQGTHEALMERCEVYREIYSSQQEGGKLHG